MQKENFGNHLKGLIEKTSNADEKLLNMEKNLSENQKLLDGFYSRTEKLVMEKMAVMSKDQQSFSQMVKGKVSGIEGLIGQLIDKVEAL